MGLPIDVKKTTSDSIDVQSAGSNGDREIDVSKEKTSIRGVKTSSLSKFLSNIRSSVKIFIKGFFSIFKKNSKKDINREQQIPKTTQKVTTVAEQSYVPTSTKVSDEELKAQEAFRGAAAEGKVTLMCDSLKKILSEEAFRGLTNSLLENSSSEEKLKTISAFIRGNMYMFRVGTDINSDTGELKITDESKVEARRNLAAYLRLNNTDNNLAVVIYPYTEIDDKICFTKSDFDVCIDRQLKTPNSTKVSINYNEQESLKTSLLHTQFGRDLIGGFNANLTFQDGSCIELNRSNAGERLIEFVKQVKEKYSGNYKKVLDNFFANCIAQGFSTFGQKSGSEYGIIKVGNSDFLSNTLNVKFDDNGGWTCVTNAKGNCSQIHTSDDGIVRYISANVDFQLSVTTSVDGSFTVDRDLSHMKYHAYKAHDMFIY